MDHDDGFFLAPVQQRRLPSSPPKRVKRPRVEKQSSSRQGSSSEPDDLPRPLLKRRKSSPEAVVEERFTLDALAKEARRKRGVPEVEKLFEVDEVESRPRSPRRALSDLPRKLPKPRPVEEEEDDIAYSDLDESHTHEVVQKQVKQSALEALRAKRQGKLPQREASPEKRPKMSQPQLVLAPLTKEKKAKSGFRPASPAAQVKKSVPAPALKAATLTIESVAAQVAANILRDKAKNTLEAPKAIKKPAEPSRPWALPTKIVAAPKKAAPAPVEQPKASTSKTVIDLDGSDEEENAIEEDDEEAEDSLDAAFGMDQMSPRTKKKFLAIAGLLDDGDAPAKGDKLNGDWDEILEQEKVPRKTIKRGKTWNGYRGRGKPWFRRGRGRGGRGGKRK